MKLPRTWLRGLAIPVVIVLVACAIAWVEPLVGVACLAIGMLAWAAVQLWQLELLTRWATQPNDVAVPAGRGTWREAFTALYRRTRTRAAHERGLAHMLERFRSAAEALPDGMVVMDEHNRIRWANARAQAQFGLDLPTDLGAPLANLVRQPELTRYLEGGDFTQAVVLPSQREARVTLSMQIVPFGVDERLLISRDISELETVARMRRDFIANVSHELKTPLTVISGFVETLQALELTGDQRRRYLQLMEDQSRTMQRLVADLLLLSALESDQSPPSESTFAVLPLLLELASDARALSRDEHRVVVEPGEPAQVTGNRDELASAFGNLVSNAIRYTPPGGTVTIAWRVDAAGNGVFGVSDTGIGIAREHIPRLTERFYRVDRSRSRATGGTGLGLAIVKHVLLRHQASLRIDSEPGKGSTFSAVVPARRVRADAGAPDDAATSTEVPRGTGS